MGHRQKGKGAKRRKGWHRGRVEGRRWLHSQIPDVRSGADPTTGTPSPPRRVGGRNRGDAA